MRAMCSAERIVHEKVAKLCESARKSRIVRLLAAQKSRVLQNENLILRKIRARLHCFVCVCRIYKRHLDVHQFLKALRNRLQGILWIWFSLRPPEMRQNNRSRSVLQQIAE